MASKRGIRRKSCEGKIKFETQAQAEKSAGSYMHFYGGWMKAYHCRFCGNYHIGHPNHRIKQAIIAQREQR